MEKNLSILWTILLFCVQNSLLINQASFYGSSYISIPLREAKCSTDIHFKFRTHLMNAIILLVAGTTDHCLVQLEDGHLKVNINLGTGDSELESHTKLNDGTWHDVVIIRRDANLSMLIDNAQSVKKKLPGKYFELNINFGLHVAGHGNHTEFYFGHVVNFRGCLAELVYNGMPVLEHARKRLTPAIVVRGVTWNCASEFDSDVQRPISFVEDGAFITLASGGGGSGSSNSAISSAGSHLAKLSLQLKTQVAHALLLYNAGQPQAPRDYFSLEVWQGRVKATLRHQDKLLENTNEEPVTNGQWHTVAVKITGLYLEVTVDENVKSVKMPPGIVVPQVIGQAGGSGSISLGASLMSRASSAGVDLDRIYYVGGVEASKRTRAMSKGLKTSDSSFRGCLRHLVIGEVALGLPDILASEYILPGCVWNHCRDDGGKEHCASYSNTSNANANNDDDKHAVLSRTSLANDLQLLVLDAVEVMEGGNALINNAHLHVVLDYPKYGIADTGVRFYVTEAPAYGTVTIDGNWLSSGASAGSGGNAGRPRGFSVADLGRDKVHYVHDGAEVHRDTVGLEVEFAAGEEYILPAYLQGRFKFTLEVNVLPVNDAPTMRLTSSSVLRLPEGGRKIVDPFLFRITDPDTATDQLVYSFTDTGPGHFERLRRKGGQAKGGQPTTVASSFTQQDVDDGRISYVHQRGGNKTYITMTLSDGVESTGPVHLRVATFVQHWRLLNNTGLVLMYHSSALITSNNLSFASNVANTSDEEAQYTIVTGPNYGVVERERDQELDVGDNWEQVNTFTGDDLRRRRLRYRHSGKSGGSDGIWPDYDEFQFQTNLNISTQYVFRLTFSKCRLVSALLSPSGKSVQLITDKWRQVRIDTTHLHFQTSPVRTADISVVYTLARRPRFGHLYLAQSQYVLGIGDSFTQEDMKAGNVLYSTFHTPYSSIFDAVVFYVSVKGCGNITTVLSIQFELPSVPQNLKVHFEHLNVQEGGQTLINSDTIDLKSNVVSELIYNITKGPTHGSINVVHNTERRNNSNYFTSDDLIKKTVFYVHDDTESSSDSFEFQALSVRASESFQFVQTLTIDVKLRNDNGPTRAIDKIFYVVVGGERLLTGVDLRYSDADIDTKAQNIIYTCNNRDASGNNGELYNIEENPSKKINEFTQADLDGGRILFKHKGSEYGKVKFSVTDGHHYVNGVLEVQASAPFVLVQTSRLLVAQGKQGALGPEHLNYATNLYVTDADVAYRVTSSALSGRLMSRVTNKEVFEFHQTEINNGKIYYANEVASASADEIELKVQCRDAITVAKLAIWILPSGYWEPIRIKNARMLMVEEGTSAILSKSVLEVMQPNVPPSALTYHIVEFPSNGYIGLLPSLATTTYLPQASDVNNPTHGDKSISTTTASADETMHIRLFTQSQLNDNRLIYIQAIANETWDRIQFNVTNGLVWLNSAGTNDGSTNSKGSSSGLTLEIRIIPERLYLGSVPVNVSEGGQAAITLGHLFVLTEYYISRVTDYIILEAPQYGCLQVQQKRCLKLQGFTHKQLVAGVVKYAHNGGEDRQDTITVVAVAGQRRSIPITIQINIQPVNDQLPVLVNNTGITMYEGGIATITNAMLAATDLDQPKEVLRFEVISNWWGNVLLASNEAVLQVFTQDLIDRGLVLFRHMNGSEAKFIFTITDGLHTSREYTFQVRTEPVIVSLRLEPLHIFPLQRKYITASHLLATASDPQRSCIYRIMSGPSLGRIMTESAPNTGAYRTVNTFTQEDLNNSRVFYEHTHPFADLYANDSMVFDVHAGIATPLLANRLQIDISVSSGGLDAYVAIPKISVDEGGLNSLLLNISAVVQFLERHAGLRSPIIHASVRAKAPRHGRLFLLGAATTDEDTLVFTQQQLESGQIQYQHDHSDSMSDDVTLALYLLPGYIPLCNVTVPITINPINDQPFRLVTPAPLLIVVQGENYTLSRLDLCTEDADTVPHDLLYDIISGPLDGTLILLPLGVHVNHFSQQDINDGHLVYIHNGTAATDSLHLRVWDGKFRPEYTVLSVNVRSIELVVSAGHVIYLQQGSNVAPITHKQFHVETNANRSRLVYGIREQAGPQHGRIYVADKPAMQFTQSDLLSDRVMYMQTDMTTANDSLTVYVYISGADSSYIAGGDDVLVSMFVQPLMQLAANVTVIVGEANRLSLHVLDATPLAKLTNSNPRYRIVRSPQYGQLRKIIRSSGERRNVLDTAISSFTHEEVQGGLVYLVVNEELKVDWHGLKDKMVFVLAASIFQPAIGELAVYIRTLQSINEVYGGAGILPGPNDPAGHEGGMHYASPNMTRDYFLIVSMVAGVIILGVGVIVIIKCRSFVPVSELQQKQEQLRLQAPMPMVGLGRSSSGGGGGPQQQPLLLPPPLPSPLGLSKGGLVTDTYLPAVTPVRAGSATSAATLPHCKVTPLTSRTRSRCDLDNSRYPYGVDDHLDDWSSCDASSNPPGSGSVVGGVPATVPASIGPGAARPNNVMLRRNQYWV